MSTVLYAVILLIFRVISMSLIIDVIKKQRQLRKRPIKDHKVVSLREDMYKLAILAMAMNIIPIIVDVLTLFSFTTRPATINVVSVVYMFSYSFGTLLLTGIIWRMYRDSLR